MKNLIYIFLIIFTFSCYNLDVVENRKVIPVYKEEYKIDISKRDEKVNIAVIDEINGKLSNSGRYIFDRSTLNNKSSKILSHGEIVSLNLINSSINTNVYSSNVRNSIINVDKINENIRKYQDKDIHIFNLSVAYIDDVDNILKNKNNYIVEGSKKILEPFSDNNDLIVISSGNTLENLKEPSSFFPASFPQLDDNFRKNIINVVGLINKNIIIYEKDKRVIYEPNYYKSTYDDSISFGKNNDYYMYKNSSGNYFTKASKSRMWSVAHDAESYILNDGSLYKLGVGSSFAAPKVTALIGEIKSKFPFLTYNQLKQVLLTTAYRDTEELSDYVGWGVVDENKALKGPARFVKALVEEDLENYKYSEDSRYFVANIPENSIYEFSNDIYGAINGNYDNNYPESERNLYIDAGLKKIGKGTLILKGNQYYNQPIKVEEGKLILENSYIKGNVEALNSDMVINNNLNTDTINTYNSNVYINSNLISNNSNFNRSNLIFNRSTLKSKKINLDLNSIKLDFIPNGEEIINFDNLEYKEDYNLDNLIKLNILKDKVVVEPNLDASEFESLNNLRKVYKEIIDKNDEKLKETIISIQNEKEEIDKISGQIYSASNRTLFETLEVSNDEISNRLLNFDKNNYYFNIFINRNDYENKKNLKISNTLNSLSMGFENNLNKFLYGFNIKYFNNMTKYSYYNVYNFSKGILLSNYFKFNHNNLNFTINNSFGLSYDDYSLDKSSSKNNSYIYSFDTKFIYKSNNLKPYLGYNLDLLLRGSISEEGIGLLVEANNQNFLKSKIYLGFNLEKNIEKLKLNFLYEAGFDILSNNSYLIKYKGINSKFYSETIPFEKNYIKLGIASKYRLSKNIDFNLDYRTKNFKNNTIVFGINYFK